MKSPEQNSVSEQKSPTLINLYQGCAGERERESAHQGLTMTMEMKGGARPRYGVARGRKRKRLWVLSLGTLVSQDISREEVREEMATLEPNVDFQNIGLSGGSGVSHLPPLACDFQLSHGSCLCVLVMCLVFSCAFMCPHMHSCVLMCPHMSCVLMYPPVPSCVLTCPHVSSRVLVCTY